MSTRISDKEVSSRVRIILASRTIGGPLKTRAASGIADFNELIAKAQEKAPFRRWLDRGQRRRDLEALGAEVLDENQPMLAVFRRSCLPMHIKRDGRFNRTRLGTDCGLRVDAAVLRQHKLPPDRQFGIL